MTLVDTSVWVGHLRRTNRRLQGMLVEGRVSCHPFVIGELACGNLRRRGEFLGLLARLPAVPVAEHDEAIALIERHGLAGQGLGWVDVHLLTSALLSPTKLWTLDKRLASAAYAVGVAQVTPA